MKMVCPFLGRETRLGLNMAIKMERALQRMSTGMEKVFRRTSDGYYREYTLHWLYFIDEAGLKTSKLDKEIPGMLWKVARPGEHSTSGECMYQFPELEEPIRLVCLGKNW